MEVKALINRIKAIKPLQWLILFVFICVAISLLLSNQQTTGALSNEETRISAILSTIEGAGKTEVALYYLQKDSTSSVFSSQGIQSAPVGVIIVSEGAGDISVRLNLIRAVRTLLGLSEDAVEVFVMDSSKKERIP